MLTELCDAHAATKMCVLCACVFSFLPIEQFSTLQCFMENTMELLAYLQASNALVSGYCRVVYSILGNASGGSDALYSTVVYPVLYIFGMLTQKPGVGSRGSLLDAEETTRAAIFFGA